MNLNAVLAEAIAKGAGRVTRKPIAALRRDVAELKRQVAELKRALREAQKGAAAPEPAGRAVEEAEALPRIRPTGPMVRRLRARLGLTQAEFAKLAGVAGMTVYKWEKADGRINPRGRALTGLVRVMGMGKRAAKRALEAGEAGEMR